MQRQKFADMLVRYFGFDITVAAKMSERITAENYQNAVSKLMELRNRMTNDMSISDRAAYTYAAMDNMFRGVSIVRKS